MLVKSCVSKLIVRRVLQVPYHSLCRSVGLYRVCAFHNLALNDRKSPKSVFKLGYFILEMYLTFGDISGSSAIFPGMLCVPSH